MRNTAAAPERGERLAGFVFFLVWVYLLLEYVRPHDMAGVPITGLGLLLTVVLTLIWMMKGDKTILDDPLIRANLGFLGVMVVSLLVTVNQYWWYETTKSVAIYTMAVTFPCAAFLSTPPKISRVLGAFVLFNVLGALWAITHAGRGPGSILGDENDMAIALGMALPFAWFLAQSPRNSVFKKACYLAASAVIVLGIVSTMSRGGFVGLVVVGMGILMLSPNKLRNLFLGLLFSLAVLSQAPQKFWDEMGTISNTRDSTREERLYSWRRSWEMFVDNPIIGVGAGNWGWRVQAYEIASGEYSPEIRRSLAGRVAHSLYFTLLPELGLAGTIVYFMMIGMIFRRLLRVFADFKKNEDDPDRLQLLLLSRAAMVSLVGFLAAGAFITVLYYPHFWILIGFVVAIDRAARTLERTRSKRTGRKAPPISKA